MKVTNNIEGSKGHRPAPRLEAGKWLNVPWWERPIREAVAPKPHLYYP